MIRDYLNMAVGNLKHRGFRSWLTMVGIFIGIAAVIAVISLGQGLEIAIFEQFNELGSDKLWIQPGTSAFGGTSSAAILTEDDRKVIERSQGVIATTAIDFQNARIHFKDETKIGLVEGYIVGKDDLWGTMNANNLLDGRWPKRGESTKAVFGYDYTREDVIFKRPLKLFDSVKINNVSVQVVGFYEKLGNSADDSAIYIPQDGYERVFDLDMEEDYTYIIAQTASGVEPEIVAERVRKDLRDFRDRDAGDEDFTLQTSEELIESFNTILVIVQVVIFGIAAISLLVGGIGITNTMYTAVVERTQEIGIMKAIGATNKEILTIFLIESGLLGLIGGAVGVITGLLAAKSVQWLGNTVLDTNLLLAWWSWELIVAALIFTFVVGVASGLLPAYQASKQQAVESLRYE